MSIETKILHCCQVPVEDARFITESNVKGLRPCGGPIQARSNGHSLSLPGDPTPTSLPSIVREKLYTKPDVVIRPIYAPDFKNQRCVFHENSTMAANGLLCSKTEQVQRHDLNAFKVDQQSLNTLYHAAMASEARLLPENNPFSAEEQRAYQDHMKTSSSDHHTSSAEKTPCNATDTRRCGECGRTISRANLARHLRLHANDSKLSCHICNRNFDRPDRLATHLRAHEASQQQPDQTPRTNTADAPSTRPGSPKRLQIQGFTCGNRLDLKSLNEATMEVEAGIESADPGLTAQPQTTIHRQQAPQHGSFKVTKPRSPVPYHRSHNPADKRTCGVCKKSVHQKALREHMRTHTGEKQHKCRVCSYASCHSQGLKKHVQRLHPEQAEQ